MKLSIIIVSYNEKKYLSEAIESCLNQDIGDFEIIIGDDGSSDGSIQIIQEYFYKYPERIRYFIMERDNTTDVIASIRVSNVLKKAFDIAKGKYISVLSGDDIFLDDGKSCAQVEYLDKHKEYASCYTDYVKFWDDGEIKKINCDKFGKNAVFWGIRYVHISSFVFRHEAVNNLLPRFCDDTGLIFSLLITGRSTHIPGFMFGYRQRNNSIMHDADMLELSILELALYQDVLNKGRYRYSSMARFYLPLRYVYKNRSDLEKSEYKKYINSNREYPNDFMQEIIEYDNCTLITRIKILWKIFCHKSLYIFFKVIGKLTK